MGGRREMPCRWSPWTSGPGGGVCGRACHWWRGGRDRGECCPGHLPGDVSREDAVSVCSRTAALKGKAALKAAIREVGGNTGVGAQKECVLPLLNSGQNSSESPEGPDSFVFTITSWNDRGKKGKILHVHSIASSFPKYKKKSLINTFLCTGVRNTFTSHLPSFYTFLNCMLDTAFLPTDC